MADIILKDDGSAVTLNFDLRTPQQFYYVVEVADDQLKQYFHGTGQSGGTTSFPLGKTGDLIGKYLNISWTVIDDNGAGNPYNASASAFQNGKADLNPQVCTGSTSDSPSNFGTTGKFIQQS
jgi:hypothetical protein